MGAQSVSPAKLVERCSPQLLEYYSSATGYYFLRLRRNGADDGWHDLAHEKGRAQSATPLRHNWTDDT